MINHMIFILLFYDIQEILNVYKNRVYQMKSAIKSTLVDVYVFLFLHLLVFDETSQLEKWTVVREGRSILPFKCGSIQEKGQ